MTDTHVVFGAAGSLGAAVANRLAADGKQVRAVVRHPQKAQGLIPESVEICAVDASDANAAVTACEGAAVVYHCINVPYTQWTAVMPRVTANILAAARCAKARLVFPGNVYGYGRFQAVGITEDHPKAAVTKKGRLRNELEKELLDAHQSGDVPVVIPRFPDYYGTNVTNPLFGAMFEAAIENKSAMWLANADVLHDLVYIEDAARACVLLADDDSAYGQVWHVPGAGPMTGRQFIEMVFASVELPPRVKLMSAGFIRFGGLFNPMAREIAEMSYLFAEPQVMNGDKFARAYPQFAYTSHEEAVRRTLEWFRSRRR